VRPVKRVLELQSLGSGGGAAGQASSTVSVEFCGAVGWSTISIRLCGGGTIPV
jgi:hypothetical protein